MFQIQAVQGVVIIMDIIESIIVINADVTMIIMC
jgi:hypothetical protein